VVRGVKGSLDWSTSALLAAASASDAARQPEGAPPPETFVKVRVTVCVVGRKGVGGRSCSVGSVQALVLRYSLFKHKHEYWVQVHGNHV
jgi:hypothetical protein